jgi:hypothetical protein
MKPAKKPKALRAKPTLLSFDQDDVCRSLTLTASGVVEELSFFYLLFVVSDLRCFYASGRR